MEVVRDVWSTCSTTLHTSRSPIGWSIMWMSLNCKQVNLRDIKRDGEITCIRGWQIEEEVTSVVGMPLTLLVVLMFPLIMSFVFCSSFNLCFLSWLMLVFFL